MEHLRCVVERITFHNETNGYSVIKCRAKGFKDLIAVTGEMPEVHVGSVLTLLGSWKVDPKYGRQFAIKEFSETLPASVYGIEKYLGSGLIKGIGPKYAKKIVNKFGKDTLDVIEENPERLREVPGIGNVRIERIKKSWNDQKEIKNIMLFLQDHDVSTSLATKIYKTYGSESLDIVRDNPYRLADDIWGIGFKTADQIAEKLGFGHEKYVRLRSGIIYTLNKLSEDGHCFATRDMLLKTGSELLKVEDNLLSITLDEMIKQQDVIRENVIREDVISEDVVGENLIREGMVERDEITPREVGNPEENAENPRYNAMEIPIYLPPFFFAESGTARRLAAILKTPSRVKIKKEGLRDLIARRTGISYDDIQLSAIELAVESKLLILTGGPGTGKTTTTKGILSAFLEAGASILLAAPTGRAAKRLSESTGMESKTIHRLLEYKPPEGYIKNQENPLEGDVLIVDECSMIDIILMYNLLKAVPDTMKIILVGDIDQLPSVGPGNVLRDMIDSGCFPMVRLKRIFRQAQKSRIIMNAHRINSGKMPDISNGRTTDFFFKEENDPEKAAETIVSFVSNKLPGYYHIPPREIQVLSPMQRGQIGAANLNLVLQNRLNPNSVGLRHGGTEYRLNDKVMQIRNNYDKEVFNGDIGFINSVDIEDKCLSVNFDGRLVPYDITELDELVLSYAVTIHKSQGSEYPIVVIPVLMSHYIMLERNLIYTGITRAKKILVLVGSKKALALAVHKKTVEERKTMLKERLKEALP